MPDQFLQAELLVGEGNTSRFEDLSMKFRNEGGFARVLGDDPAGPQRYELTLALRSTVTFPHSSFSRVSGTGERPSPFDHDYYRNSTLDPTTKVYRYVHLWKIKDDADLNLSTVMKACGEDPLYLSIDALVIEEAQNFISRVKTPGPIPQITGARRFVRATRRLNHEDIGKFMFCEPMLFPSLEVAGWHHLGSYQSFSGLLNAVTEFWQTTSEAPLRDMFASVDRPNLPENAPANVLALFKTDVRESYVALPYSPSQGSSL